MWGDLLESELTDSDALEWPFVSSGIYALAESESLTGKGVRVCVVDTGINANHPDFSSTKIVFRDFLGLSEVPIDRATSTHGTMMAGLLAANGTLRGAAPDVTLLVAVALGDDVASSGTDDRVSRAIEWCWKEQNSDIISLSLGGAADVSNPMGSRTVEQVEMALDRGVFVVAAAGNDGGAGDDGFVATPANVDDVIAVGAISRNSTLWDFSSAGSSIEGASGKPRHAPDQKPELVAPGASIISTGAGALYFQSSGTSDATVFVTGALALVLEAEPELQSSHPRAGRGTIALVKEALKSSAQPTPYQAESGHDLRYGYGALDAVKFHAEVSAALNLNS